MMKLLSQCVETTEAILRVDIVEPGCKGCDRNRSIWCLRHRLRQPVLRLLSGSIWAGALRHFSLLSAKCPTERDNHTSRHELQSTWLRSDSCSIKNIVHALLREEADLKRPANVVPAEAPGAVPQKHECWRTGDATFTVRIRTFVARETTLFALADKYMLHRQVRERSFTRWSASRPCPGGQPS